MSFAAKKQIKQFKKRGFKNIVANSFLKPNQKYNLFNDRNDVTKEKIAKGQIVTFAIPQGATSRVLYFHGGGFTVPMNEQQLNMISAISDQSAAALTVMDFPLLGQATAKEMLTFSETAVKSVIQKTKLPIFIIADSAGATLGLQAYLHNRDQIAGMGMVSPWLDLDLSTITDDSDVELSSETLKIIAKRFKSSLNDYAFIDPFDSDNLAGLSIEVFAGNKEILQPSITRFVDAINNATNATAHVTFLRDGFHDYVLWPNLPETKKTTKQLAAFVTSLRDV